MHFYATTYNTLEEQRVCVIVSVYRTQYAHLHAGILESASHQRQTHLHRKQSLIGKPPARCLPVFRIVSSDLIESRIREIFHIHLPRRVDTR